eukprot:jgi/Mesvir1/19644/Mv09927-RA.1
MPAFRSPFNGYAVQFSPFLEDRLAVATAQNFGIIGNGRLHILQMVRGSDALVPIVSFDTADGLYDCCWCEDNENIIASASGDGSIKIWDMAAPPQANPLKSFNEHTHEAYCLAWNYTKRDLFLSASWDDTVKLWSVAGHHSLRSFAEHTYCVYGVTWSPANPEVFASCSGDCTLRVWDLREPKSTVVIRAHEYEVLTCDWSKYSETLLVTGSVDKSIRVWDIRNPRQPMHVLQGHSFAVRRLKCSPHRPTEVASCSYDMTACLWDFSVPENALLARFTHHTEFAVGIDMSVLTEGLMATTGWDEMTYVWPRGADPRAPLL